MIDMKVRSYFQKKLKDMCVVTRKTKVDDGGHWILKGSKIVRIPGDSNRMVTAKVAAYAAFVGPVPAGKEVERSCPVRGCIRPEHQVLVEKPGSNSRGLDLSEYGEKFMELTGFRPREKPSKMPKGIGPNHVSVVKLMRSEGSDIASIATTLNISRSDVVKCMNGVFSEASARASRRGSSTVAARAARVDAAGSGDGARAATNVDESMTEDEKLWLRTITS